VHAVLLTDARPDARTGGSSFHRRIAERAPGFGVDVDVGSVVAPTDVGPLVSDADVVVVDSIVAALVDPLRLVVPCVASVHQRPGGLVGPIGGRVAGAVRDLRCYARAAAVVVPSAYLGGVLRRCGVAPRRIHVVEPGSPARLPPSASLPVARPPARRDVSFVCVANLSAHKRVCDLLEAFATLGDLDVSLTLVGGAADAATLEDVRSRIAGPDLRGRVRWVGSLPPEGVQDLVRAADTFVLPALGESYGMAVAEAQCAGVPAIVARSGNLPNLVGDGVDGYVVPPRDPGSLAAAMRRLATDPARRAAMSAAAYARSSRLPSWDEAAERFCAVLRAVVASPDRAASGAE
jgi:glycosyltransferase involved in cell wall biosynthesis